MKIATKHLEVPAVVNRRVIGSATFTVTATEFPGEVIAYVSYGEKLIGHLRFAAGTGFENVMTTVRERLTPLGAWRVARAPGKANSPSLWVPHISLLRCGKARTPHPPKSPAICR